jgi:hypothetical protein
MALRLRVSSKHEVKAEERHGPAIGVLRAGVPHYRQVMNQHHPIKGKGQQAEHRAREQGKLRKIELVIPRNAGDVVNQTRYAGDEFGLRAAGQVTACSFLCVIWLAAAWLLTSEDPLHRAVVAAIARDCNRQLRPICCRKFGISLPLVSPAQPPLRLRGGPLHV